VASRTKARRLAIDVLYQSDVTGTDGRAVLTDWEEAGREVPAFTRDLVHGVAENLEELEAITIVAEQRTIADREMEASVHQIRIELGAEDPQRPLLIAERWAEACVAERHAEITEA